MIDIVEIAGAVQAYLRRYPEDAQRLEPLLAGIDGGSAITDRTAFTGHVTCSAVLVDERWRVLHIHHNVLGIWLRPGGHLEPTDVSLTGAALRELTEETGIPEELVRLRDGTVPIDIDAHIIPANPGRGEPAHPHFDVSYIFTLLDPSATLRLQAEEVNAYRWVSADAVQPEMVRNRLARLRRSS
jgi:8-oxo-dGTP pyrophosphatase MutT (NUDIX family)